MREAAQRALALILCSACAVALAQDDVEAAYRAATEAERRGEPEAALDAWREVIALAPGSRMASRAERRRAWLEERSEDGFGPLRALWAFQHDDAPDAAERAAFAEAIGAMPEGRVRVEARLVLAAAWERAGEHARAVECYRAVLAEPAVRGDEAALARDELAGALAGGGDLEGALAELEAAGMDDAARHGFLLRAQRRRWLEPAAWAAIVAFVALAGLAFARGDRRAGLATLREPGVLALAALIGAAPYVLARSADDEAYFAFAVFGAANAASLLGAFAVARALGTTPHRAAVPALSVALVLAVAAFGYLTVLHHAPSLPFT